MNDEVRSHNSVKVKVTESLKATRADIGVDPDGRWWKLILEGVRPKESPISVEQLKGLVEVIQDYLVNLP